MSRSRFLSFVSSRLVSPRPVSHLSSPLRKCGKPFERTRLEWTTVSRATRARTRLSLSLFSWSTLVLYFINGRLRNDNGVDCYACMLVVSGTVVNGSGHLTTDLQVATLLTFNAHSHEWPRPSCLYEDSLDFAHEEVPHGMQCKPGDRRKCSQADGFMYPNGSRPMYLIL